MLAHLLCVVSNSISFFLDTNMHNLETTTPFVTLNVVSSSFYFVLAKTVPSLTIIHLIVLSLSILVCFRTIIHLKKLLCVLFCSLAICELAINLFVQNITFITDITFTLSTLLVTIVLCIFLTVRYNGTKTLLILEYKIVHLETLYTAIMYSCALIEISINNYVPNAFKYVSYW